VRHYIPSTWTSLCIAPRFILSVTTWNTCFHGSFFILCCRVNTTDATTCLTTTHCGIDWDLQLQKEKTSPHLYIYPDEQSALPSVSLIDNASSLECTWWQSNARKHHTSLPSLTVHPKLKLYPSTSNVEHVSILFFC